MKFLIAAACIALAVAGPVKYSTGHVVIDSCTCYEKGNYYSPNSANGCNSFFQRTAWLPAEELNCPPGLKFDVNVCVCNWPNQMTCPANCPAAPPTPGPIYSCSQNGNTYATVAGTNCADFTQATAILPPVRHSCPAGLQFNVDPAVCVCDWPWRTTCRN